MAEEQEKNCLQLTAGFDCVCHSGKQGTVLRGHGDEKKTDNLRNYG